MILSASSIRHMSIMSLQTGSEIAKITNPIIDPSNLSIVAYELTGALLPHGGTSIIRLADIRELSDIGFVVDSIDEVVSPDDVIDIKKLYDLNFELLHMQVRDENGTKLGKISDYTIETGGFIVQQISVKRPLLQSMNDTELIIHRSQIIEINNEAIVVHSQAKVPEPERSAVSGSYVNPFRKSEPASESVDINQGR